jgi:hypothetical protein
VLFSFTVLFPVLQDCAITYVLSWETFPGKSTASELGHCAFKKYMVQGFETVTKITRVTARPSAFIQRSGIVLTAGQCPPTSKQPVSQQQQARRMTCHLKEVQEKLTINLE